MLATIHTEAEEIVEAPAQTVVISQAADDAAYAQAYQEPEAPEI